MDAYFKALIDSPIDTAARANKLLLPEGVRASKRLPKPEYYDSVTAPKIARSELEKRKADAASAKLVAVLDYYATTQVPFDRIAAHTKLTEDQVRESMLRRGRSA